MKEFLIWFKKHTKHAFILLNISMFLTLILVSLCWLIDCNTTSYMLVLLTYTKALAIMNLFFLFVCCIFVPVTIKILKKYGC